MQSLRILGCDVADVDDVGLDSVALTGQFARGQSFQGGQRGLHSPLRPLEISQNFLLLRRLEVECSKHLDVGAHRSQWGPQLVGGDGREVACGVERGVGAVLCLVQSGQHAADRDCERIGFGDTGAGFGCGRRLRADLPGQRHQRSDGSTAEEPAQSGGHRDRGQTEQDHLLLLLVGDLLRFDGRHADGNRDGRHRCRYGGVDPEALPVDVHGLRPGVERGQPCRCGRDDDVAAADGDGERAGELIEEGLECRRRRDQHLRCRRQPLVELIDVVARDGDRGDHRERGDHEGGAEGRGGGHSGAQREAHAASRTTKPTPRTVCRMRGDPSASSLRRRYPTNTSTTLVSATKS